MRPPHLADATASPGIDAPDEYLCTVRAARRAARLFFQTGTHLTPAQFRDQLFRDHCLRYKDGPVERRIRLDAFRQEYAATVGQIVVEEGRLRATT